MNPALWIGITNPTTHLRHLGRFLVCIVRIALLVGLPTDASSASVASPARYSDSEFENSDWALTVLTSGNGGASTAIQQTSQGNPGNLRRIAITVSSAPAAVYSCSFWTRAVYDPRTQGAIVSIDYEEDSILLVPTSNGGDGQATGPAIRQSGIVFIVSRLFTPEFQWTHKALVGLVSSDFIQWPPGPLKPDFGADADPIEVGFFRANSTRTGSYTREAGIDNWSFTINTAECPDTRVAVRETDFMDGLDGWTLVDADGGPADGSLTWQSAGGNPGGYAFFVDSGPDGGWLNAPVDVVEDLSGLFEGGEIAYDHKVVSVGGGGRVVAYRARISGPGGSAEYLGSVTSEPTAWNTVTIPLFSSEWALLGGDWQALLGNVTSLRIGIELIDGPADTDCVDNIRLLAPDPCANPSPTIISLPPTTASPEIEYQYDVQALRPGGGALLHNLLESPSGMSVDPVTGAVRWIPTYTQLGSHPVEVEVRDEPGNRDKQRYFISVQDVYADTTPPGVQLQIVDGTLALLGDQVNVVVGTILEYRVDATDDVGVTELALTIDGNDVPLDTQGRATMQMNNIGLYSLEAVARDAAGNEGIAIRSLRIYDPSDEHDPLVTIHSPVQDTLLSMRADVRVSIEDPVLESWTVDYARLDQIDPEALEAPNPAWINIGSGTASIADSTLGKFDPTILLNDAYVIRAVGTNVNGRTRTRGVVVGVYSDLKLGEFRMEFTDLTIPVSGVPIEIKRIYDSRESTDEGDFGFGWSLGIQDAKIREVLGTSPLGYRTFYQGTRVYINTPDGRRVGFTAYASNVNCFGFCFAQIAFRPDPGVYEKLEIAGDNVAVIYEGFFHGGLASAPFDPNNYRLTLKNGTVYQYSQTAGLTRVTDLNGNRLDFTNQGIYHYESGASSPDQSVAFVRDDQGRITAVVDPNGNELTYEYDEAGDLVSFADQVGNLSQFTYHADRPHYLETIIDPLGHQAIRTEFDDDGRVRSITDALGNAVTEDFDLDANSGTFTDARGYVTVSFYDDQGNVTKVVDPEGGVTEFAFDENNNEIWRKGPRGYVSTQQFDDKGNITIRTDATGAQLATAYNAQSKPLAITNALGQVTQMSYDPQGRLVAITDPTGGQYLFSHDSSGRVISTGDYNGNTTQYDYSGGCPCGQPGVIVNPDGSTRILSYNTFGQVTQETNELGDVRTSTYDSAGKLVSTTDAEGNVTTFTYAGQLKVGEMDPLGQATSYDYDNANRLVRITDGNGGVTTFEYDPAGNRIAVVDPTLNRTEFEYDGVNRMTREIDPLGSATVHVYDSAGNLIETIDRNGRSRRFVYDAVNRRTQEQWWDDGGLIRSIEFTFNTIGLMIGVSDPVATLEFEYDPLSRLKSVTQSNVPGISNFTLNYSYDGAGNVLSVTDNYGVTSESEYDVRNRLSKRRWFGAGPSGVEVRFAYDAVGNRRAVSRYSDSGGLSLIGQSNLEFNREGVPVKIEHTDASGGPILDFTYQRDQTQQIVERILNTQTTTYSYDAIGQLTAAEYSDSQPDEHFTYDLSGNRTGVGIVIGQANRLTSDDRYSYEYDEEGNLSLRTETATNQTRAYVYDHRNLLVEVEDRDAGGGVIHRVEFEYDALGRRVLESISGIETHFLYEGENVWADLDTDGLVVAHYGVGSSVDEMIARFPIGHSAEWYLSDNLGSVYTMLDSNGTSLGSIKYMSFGAIIEGAIGATADRFKFTGREWSEALGAYYLRTRYYDPHVGRFQIEDVLGVHSDDYNLYRYVRNGVTSGKDPDGRSVLLEYLTGKVIPNNLSIAASVVWTAGMCTLAIYPSILGEIEVDRLYMTTQCFAGVAGVFLQTAVHLEKLRILREWELTGRGAPLSTHVFLELEELVAYLGVYLYGNGTLR